MNLDLSQARILPFPLPGSVVSVPFLLAYRHLGIVSDRWHKSKPMIISNSARTGGVHEEPWDVFAQGKAVAVEEAYPGITHLEAIERARSRIGTPYDLFSWNCEHFVGFAKGVRPSSPQVSGTAALALLGLMFVARKGRMI